MSLQSHSSEYLLHQLQKQYPSGIATFSPCAKCESSARGNYCVDCLCNELRSRGASQNIIGHLLFLLRERQTLASRIDAAVEGVKSEMAK